MARLRPGYYGDTGLPVIPEAPYESVDIRCVYFYGLSLSNVVLIFLLFTDFTSFSKQLTENVKMCVLA